MVSANKRFSVGTWERQDKEPEPHEERWVLVLMLASFFAGLIVRDFWRGW